MENLSSFMEFSADLKSSFLKKISNKHFVQIKLMPSTIRFKIQDFIRRRGGRAVAEISEGNEKRENWVESSPTLSSSPSLQSSIVKYS